ncbi:hypothetical protein [Calothrix sp. 336/3]|uniref:hypothetical protein n=1 Tax=Calothrix sp. 336/3 TaxID=1337936 RepID=UPI0004E3338D|nr:hypothetical protein [Calothrix sp. 336/3]AKG20342.1 recombinase RecR [Calothrix sp. 336/3]
MTTYILFDDALRMLVNAFLLSVGILIAVSGFGLAVVEIVEKAEVREPAPKRFP